jgi:hypothetical protein
MPYRVKVPVKRGLYDSGYITEGNLGDFTTTEPSPKKPAKALRNGR